MNTPQNAVSPYSQLFSLSWQREVAHNYVGYTGSRSKNQINQLQANPGILTAAQAATVRTPFLHKMAVAGCGSQSAVGRRRGYDQDPH